MTINLNNFNRNRLKISFFLRICPDCIFAPRTTGCQPTRTAELPYYVYLWYMKITIINGPNLNLLGIREPGIYGSEGFGSFFDKLQQTYPDLTLSYFQSNHEGALVDKIQDVGFEQDGIILNAAAYTHTSVAIADAVAAISTPVVEVHISNVYAREAFRHHSYISPHAAGVVAGFGLQGYRMALDFFLYRQA